MTACDGCGALNVKAARFCAGCGRRLRSDDDAERRDLSVLFCDLVGSTALAQRLDPEDLQDVLGDWQETATLVVERYDGYLAQYLGDGLLAYFGYPRAHDDDARRAVLAGLAMLAQVDEVNVRLAGRGVEIAVRVGIDTGPVVVGVLGTGEMRERSAFGSTPNVAARLQALAEPGTLLVSAHTHRLIAPHFACEPRGAHVLKGISGEVEVFRVLAAAKPSRPGAGPRRRHVGRELELDTLRAGFRRAAGGIGGATLVVGEPGIGKSHLVQAFAAELADTPHRWLSCACSAYETTSPLGPLIALLEDTFALAADAPEDEKRRQLETAVDALGVRADEAMPVLAALLGLPVTTHEPPTEMSSEKQRERIFAVLLEVIASGGTSSPVVFALEDLHWADPSTREFAAHLAARAEELGVYLVATSRPVADLPGLAAERITLRGLGESDLRTLACDVAGERTLPLEVLRHVTSRTDGVPLFVEELTKAILEGDVLRLGEAGYELSTELVTLSIPTTLKGSLTARLDRLADAKPVAQLASVLGREFSYELLAAVSPFDEATLRHGLAQLVAAELLVERGQPPDATYAFRHSLIQDTAYDLLLKRVRRDYHERIARTIAERFPHWAELHPEAIARHYTEASLAEPAIGYWLRAGELALRRSAPVEAVVHLNAGLDLLARSAPTPERDGRELGFLMALGGAFRATRGYPASDVVRVLTRALELCEGLGNQIAQFGALVGLFQYHLLRSEHDRTAAIIERIQELARQLGDPRLTTVGDLLAGIRVFPLGQFATALEWLDGVAATSPTDDRLALEMLECDALVAAHMFATVTLWHLGYPDRARARASIALERAREVGHALTLACALVFSGAEFHQCRRDAAAVAEHARELHDLCEERGFPIWHDQAQMFTAWAVLANPAAIGMPAADEAVTQLAAAFARFRASGSRAAYGYFAALFAEGLAWVGRIEQAFTIIDDGLRILDESGERLWLPELHRTRGDLLLRSAAPDDADARIAAADAYATALQVAREQGSRMLELRAAVSLGRLRLAESRRDEARGLVEPLLARFTEGHAEADLHDARTLLDATR